MMLIKKEREIYDDPIDTNSRNRRKHTPER